MIENSVISSRTIYEAYCKFQRSASDHKFRTKSLRVKTVNTDLDDHLAQKIGLPVIANNGSRAKLSPLSSAKKLSQNRQSLQNLRKQRVQSYKIIEKNYQQELNSFGVDSIFLRKLFEKKCEQSQTTYNELKFQVFLRNLAQRLCRFKHLKVYQMGFGNLSLSYFFEWYPNWQAHITELDLTYAQQLLKESKQNIIKSLLKTDKKLLKITLCNSDLSQSQLNELLSIINEQKQLFALDIGNTNSQHLNRVGSDLSIVQHFFKNNQSVTIVKMNNLYLKRQGFGSIVKGVTSRRCNPLKILSLASNNISGNKICEQFYSLLCSGLTHFDLSSNPLGDDFFKQLPSLKSITLKELNLSQTKMNSENLYLLFEAIQQSKTLSALKVDKNDFSHHWFAKTGEKIAANSTLQYLSLCNCQIITFLPIFEGLTQNKLLKRVDANNNCVDILEQSRPKILDCFLFNKCLEQLRIRFCNINQQTLISIFQGMSKSKTLKILDISENTLEDVGGMSILKMLEHNTKIETIGIEKLQLSQTMRKRIITKLQENAVLRDNENFQKLKIQNKQIKDEDVYTWSDLSSYEKQEKKLSVYAKKVVEVTKVLESMVIEKKAFISDLIKSNRDEDHFLQYKIQERLQQNNQSEIEYSKTFSKLSQKEETLKAQVEVQLQKIKQLQRKIKETNENNKKRENQLEEKLRNHRYLRRKDTKNLPRGISPTKRMTPPCTKKLN